MFASPTSDTVKIIDFGLAKKYSNADTSMNEVSSFNARVHTPCDDDYRGGLEGGAFSCSICCSPLLTIDGGDNRHHGTRGD